MFSPLGTTWATPGKLCLAVGSPSSNKEKNCDIEKGQWEPTTLMIKGQENLMHENIEEIGFIYYERRLLTDMYESNHCLPTPRTLLL